VYRLHSPVRYYDTVQSGRWTPTFRRNILLPSPGTTLKQRIVRFSEMLNTDKIFGAISHKTTAGSLLLCRSAFVRQDYTSHH
jgi:hypothetical protein